MHVARTTSALLRFSPRANFGVVDFLKSIPPVTLPKLKYDYHQLEPVLSKTQLELHHAVHHATYVNNLNVCMTLYNQCQADFDYNKMASLTASIKFNLGGHINHSIMWQNLAPIGKGGGEIPGDQSLLTQLIKKHFDSYERMIDEFLKKAVPIMGSGWCFLGYNNISRGLDIVDVKDHEMIAPMGLTPLLVVDVWEHAHYVDYRNFRNDYCKQIWKIVNWKDVEDRLIKALAKK